VDAIVIALSSSRAVQFVNIAAAKAPAWQQNGRAFKAIQSPWPDFVDSIRPHIENLIASHRPSHKMSGALHKDTYYARPYTFQGKDFVNLRRPLTGLPDGQIADIVDDCVKQAVVEKLAELGGDSKKFDPANPLSLPFLAAKNGTRISIRKVRVRESKSRNTLIAIRAGFVQSEEIHHFELFVCRERQREKWSHVSVTLFDAYERKRNGRDIVSRSAADDPEANFLFSLMKGDLVELDLAGTRQIVRIKKFYASGQIWFALVNNSQKDEDQKRDGTRWSKKPDTLRELNPRKVTVDLLGRVHPAND
jgi:hypothetical protein